MKKDKEWLKERLAYYEREVNYGQYELKTKERHNAVGKIDAINKIEKFVEEMDEPEQVVHSKTETAIPTVSKKEIVEIPQFVADCEEEKLYKLKFVSKTITETHYMAYRFFSGEYKPMTTNSMGLSNGAVGWRYIFTESELETMDTTGFERVEVHE